MKIARSRGRPRSVPEHFREPLSWADAKFDPERQPRLDFRGGDGEARRIRSIRRIIRTTRRTSCFSRQCESLTCKYRPDCKSTPSPAMASRLFLSLSLLLLIRSSVVDVGMENLGTASAKRQLSLFRLIQLS